MSFSRRENSPAGTRLTWFLQTLGGEATGADDEVRNNPLGEHEGCHPGQKTRQYVLREEAGQSRESCSFWATTLVVAEPLLMRGSLHKPFVSLKMKCVA